MKLIVEQIDSQTETLIEADSNGKKSFYIKGIFAQSETKNRNGRIYPKQILEREVNKLIESKIKRGNFLGELSHPSSATVDPKNASHLIQELTFNGNDVYGKAKLLSNPIGLFARSLIEDGVTLGVSTRGLGSVRKDNNIGCDVVNEDFHLVTVDIVTDPSAPEAFVQGIMEGVEYYFESGILKEMPAIEQIVDHTQQKINEAVRQKNLKEESLRQFENFINALSGKFK